MNKQPTPSKSGARSRLFNATFPAGLLPAIVLLVSGHTSQAGSATWRLNPANGDWNTAANWTPATVPNYFDYATFASSNITDVSVSSFPYVYLYGIVFKAGASAFTITTTDQVFLNFNIVGIANNSGIAQNFVASGDDGSRIGGVITFSRTATAGNMTFFTNKGGVNGGFGGGETWFLGHLNRGQRDLH